jgi:DNA-binding MarR family transcriptional regulator
MQNKMNSQTPCPEPLGKVFSELAKAYAEKFMAYLAHLPIKRYYYALVVINDHNGDLSQTTLASELYLDKASVVRMLDYLESEDCIIRRQNPNDRRAHILELTPKAVDLIPQIREAIGRANADFSEAAKHLGTLHFDKISSALMHQFQTQSQSGYDIQFVPKDENN